MATSPPPAQREGMPTGLKILLFVVLPIVLALVIVAGVMLAGFVRAETIDSQQQAEAGSSVEVDIPNADLTFVAGADDDVVVTVEGRYSGPAPEVRVETDNGVTEITGGCPSTWFSNCGIEVTVEMPANLPLDVQGQNGAVLIDGVTALIAVHTTNGAISVSGAEDDLDLRTTNGAIEVTDSGSPGVSAITTNGRVELELTDAPTRVVGESTNGAVTVRVPTDDVSYNVTAETVNGSENTDDITIDSNSDRSISARTTNGTVTVEGLG